MTKNKIYLLLLILVVLFILAYFLSTKQNKPIRTLPYFEPKSLTKIKSEKHHSIPAFSFINQYNQKVSEQTVNNKVYVCDFFLLLANLFAPL